MNVKTLSVNCPTCKKEVLMTEESKYRPFCSKRCRDIDFGEWATESYKIESKESEMWSDSDDSEGY